MLFMKVCAVRRCISNSAHSNMLKKRNSLEIKSYQEYNDFIALQFAGMKVYI